MTRWRTRSSRGVLPEMFEAVRYRLSIPHVRRAPEPAPRVGRENRVVRLGRIAPKSQAPNVIDIVARARCLVAPEHAPALELVGSWNCSLGLSRRIETLIAEPDDWTSLSLDLPHDDLGELHTTSKFGLHATNDEHFGIEVAEMHRAGCVVPVPDTGGPREIVGEDARSREARIFRPRALSTIAWSTSTVWW